MEHGLERDVEVVRQIPAVPSILSVVSKVTGMGFAAVARVTKDHWIACEVLDNIDFGLKPGDELRVETTICSEIGDSREPVIIDDVANDPHYCGHPTPAMYGFQSYISMPIFLADGSFFGTLCAIDPRPMRLNVDEITDMFRLFAELIGVHVDARNRFLTAEQDLSEERGKRARSLGKLRSERAKFAASQDELLDAKAASELREQFIAVLGHDLRNPLAAIAGGSQLLLRRTEDEKSRAILQMMKASIQRMGTLIENVMDFARGRLGGGVTLERERKSLEPMLTTVIDEIRSAWPSRTIETEFDLAVEFDGDHARLGQLFSNLLGNAITHGAEDQPIRVTASTSTDGLKLTVANGGQAIPTETVDKLFQPFQRGGGSSSLQGLGLGLFIASEIARAHGGRLDVSSDEHETLFTLTAPAA